MEQCLKDLYPGSNTPLGRWPGEFLFWGQKCKLFLFWGQNCTLTLFRGLKMYAYIFNPTTHVQGGKYLKRISMC